MQEKNNDVVIITLDKPRELIFKHKELKHIKKLMGKTLAQLDLSAMDPEDIEKLLFIGLKRDDPNLELKNMEDLLDQAPEYGDVILKFSEAIEKCLGKNFMRAAEQKMQKNGIGKNP